MPLPVTDVERELRHTRRVRYEGYKRPTDVGHRGHLTDIKSHDNPMKTGVRAGQPIHEMWIRLTIDRHSTILDATASSDAVPYPGGCENIAPSYKRLIGLNLVRDFRAVKNHFAAVKGCTHLTEMLTGFPTAAIQTFAGEMPEERTDGRKPFQLDQCHALDTGSDTVKLVPRGTRARRRENPRVPR